MWDLPALAKDLFDLICEKTMRLRGYKHPNEIKVLHAACGAGHLCFELMKLGLTGLDMSDANDDMLALAEQVGQRLYPKEWEQVSARKEKVRLVWRIDASGYVGDELFPGDDPLMEERTRNCCFGWGKPCSVEDCAGVESRSQDREIMMLMGED